jgi:hypothetical protein
MKTSTGLNRLRKKTPTFCHSKRSEESLFLFLGLNRGEIPRFAWNDKINYFFRNLLKPLLLSPQIIRLPILNQLLDGLAVVEFFVEDFAREGRKLRVARKTQ